MQRWFADAALAVRALRKHPRFTIVAALTLALGIGATTAIFSVVNGVLLQPLPYPHSEGLVRVHEVVPNYGLFAVAPANVFDWRAQNHVFDGLAAYGSTSATLAQEDGPERIQGFLVSWNLFQVVGAVPALGSTLTPDEDKPGSDNVIVI